MQDTAGQERFSSLSSAFFRGADAVLLVFDASKPSTLSSLKHWWSTFSQHVPIHPGEERLFPAVIVGSKEDLGRQVGEEEIRMLIDELVPPMPEDVEQQLFLQSSTTTQPISTYPPPPPSPLTPPSTSTSFFSFRSASPPGSVLRPGRGSAISIKGSKKSSRSRSQGSAFVGTMRTGLTVFHTPASSIFNGHAGHSNKTPSASVSRATSPAPSVSDRIRARRINSLTPSVASEASAAPTVTPRGVKHFRRRSTASILSLTHAGLPASSNHVPLDPSALHRTLSATAELNGWPASSVPPCLMRPRFAYASAQSGAGVKVVFDHLVERCARLWAWEEEREDRRMSVRDGVWDNEQVVLEDRGRRGRSGCC
jgi:Ras-related protein Rab-7A